MKVAFIIPTLNERESLPILFTELVLVYNKLKNQGYELEIIVVDDDSSDGTQAYIEQYSSERSYGILGKLWSLSSFT